MKKVLLVACAALLLTAAAFADSACVQGSLASYAGTSCSYGGLTFTFGANPYAPTGNAPSIGSIVVTPYSDGSSSGFTFSGPLGLLSGSLSEDINITFTVSTGGPAIIEDASFFNLAAGIVGSGSALAITESLCGGSTPGVCNPNTALFGITTGPGTYNLQDHVVFDPTGQVIAVKDIQAQTGAGGAVAFSSVTDTFSFTPVPEPGSVMLFGSGLLGLAGILRRRLLG